MALNEISTEPSEALSTAAQIAVALAGFAGVVVVFRRESVHEWSPIDKLRLRLLLIQSVLPLALCMFGLLFLTINPLPAGIWKWCSGLAFVILVLFAIMNTTIFRRLHLHQVRSYGRATHFVFYLFGILGAAVTIRQLYNAAILGAFAPFLTLIVSNLPSQCFSLCALFWLPPNKAEIVLKFFTMHICEVRSRKDKRGVDLVCDVLPFGRRWYAQRNAVAKRDIDGKSKFRLDFVI